MRREARILAAVMLLALSGCDFYYNTLPSPDDLMKAVPWFDHMVKSPAVHPYESGAVPRRTVPGTVPVTRSEDEWGLAWGNGDFAIADAIVNPTDPEATLVAGDSLYQIYCSVCHGQTGAGNGPVSAKVGAPSILAPKAVALSEGHIYSVIRYDRPTSIAAWRRGEREAVTSKSSAPTLDADLELSAVPTSRALVPVEVTSSSVRGEARLTLVTPRGVRIEGLSLEQAAALVREFL